jgi:hypothetical protein
MWIRTKHIREISHFASKANQWNCVGAVQQNTTETERNSLRRFSPKVEIGKASTDKSIMRARDN